MKRIIAVVVGLLASGTALAQAAPGTPIWHDLKVGMTEQDVAAMLPGSFKDAGHHYTPEFEEGVGRACWAEKPRWCGDIRYDGKTGPIKSIEAFGFGNKADAVEAGLVAKYGQPLSETSTGENRIGDKREKVLRWSANGIAITFTRRNEYAPSDTWKINYVVGGASTSMPL